MAQTAKVADEEAKAEALRAYQKGMAHYNLNEFDDAIRQFEAGYRSVPQAVFLYNIAQAHRLAERSQKALEFYRKYLKQDPGAKNFREVQDRIEALERLIADSNKPPGEPMPPPQTAPLSPPSPRPAPPADPVAPQAAAEPPAAATPSAEPSPAPLTIATRAAPRAVPRRKILPIVFGVIGGVVVVGVAVGLGVYFGTKPQEVPIWQAVTP